MLLRKPRVLLVSQALWNWLLSRQLPQERQQQVQELLDMGYRHLVWQDVVVMTPLVDSPFPKGYCEVSQQQHDRLLHELEYASASR